MPPQPGRGLPARKPSDTGWWIGGFLFGFAVGLALSLTYGWVLDPQPLPVQPADLRQRDKEFYIRLIAVAFAHNQNLEQARARLNSLAEPDINGLIVGLTERYIIENRDVRDIMALVKLSDALGQTSVPMLAFLATPTPKPTATPSPAPTPTPRPTRTPTPRVTPTPKPSPTRTATSTPTLTQTPTRTPTPTDTPTPGPNAPFGVAQSVLLCDKTLSGLLRIYVRDRLGQGVPGVAITVDWAGGQDKLFTGFKPEIDSGYADFQMEPDERYQVKLVSVAMVDQTPAEVTISGENLCADLPAGTIPSWQIVFQQGASR